MSGASRYQNALIYDPSLYVGRYPERSANTLPRASLGGSSTRPMVFDPVPELVTGTSPLPIGAVGGGGGNALIGAAGTAGLAGLATSIGVKGIGKLAQIGSVPGLTPGISIAPGLGSDPLTIADPVSQGMGTLAPLSALPGTLGGAMTGGQWLASQPSTIAPPLFSGGTLLDDVGDGFTLLGGGTPQPWGDLSFAAGNGGVEAGSTIASALPAATALPDWYNPAAMVANLVGAYAGGRLASSLVEGDQEQQPMASSIGGSVGGLLGGVGSFIGSLIGGTLFAGEPDYPIGYFGGYADYADGGPTFRTGNPGTTNGAPGGAAAGMSNALGGILAQRAAAAGLSVAPQFVNQQLFNAGIRADGKNDRFFYNAGDGVPAAADHPMWRGFTFDQLADFAYGDLVGRGVFAAPGTGPSWTDVQANIQGQGDFAGGLTYTGNSEAGNTYTNFDPRGWQTNTYAPPVAAYTGPEIISSGSMGG